MSGGLRRLFDRAGEHGANAPIFQHQQAGNGATGRSGDVVAESRGMPARVEHHARGPQSGLGYQRQRELPRQTHAHPGVGQRLHDQKLVTGSAAAQRSDRVEVDLVDRQTLAHAFEDAFGAIQMSL